MIQALAIRMAAVRALVGNTIAGSRVYDSAISSIDELVSEDGLNPVIIVSTDEETVTSISAQDAASGKSEVQFVVEIAIASKLTRRLQSGAAPNEVETVVTIPETDAGLEISLAVLHRELTRALFYSQSAWSKVFRGLIGNIDKIHTQRGASGVKDGTKYAARQIVFTLATYSEPVFGGVPYPDSPLSAFLEAVDADQEVARLGPLLRDAIKGEAIPDWRIVFGQAVISDPAADFMGLVPSLDADGNPVTISEIDYESALGTINQGAVDQFLPPEEPAP